MSGKNVYNLIVLASHGQSKPSNSVCYLFASPTMFASGLLAAVPLEAQDRRHPRFHCDWVPWRRYMACNQMVTHHHMLPMVPTPKESETSWHPHHAIVDVPCHSNPCWMPAGHSGDWAKSHKMLCSGAYRVRLPHVLLGTSNDWFSKWLFTKPIWSNVFDLKTWLYHC